jgi:hypothetical protein
VYSVFALNITPFLVIITDIWKLTLQGRNNSRITKIYLSMALQPFGRFFSFLLFTQSVELFGRGISASQGRYLHTGEHKHRVNTHKHSCFEWDSNPWSECSSERKQFMPQTARALWSRLVPHILPRQALHIKHRTFLRAQTSARIAQKTPFLCRCLRVFA